LRWGEGFLLGCWRRRGLHLRRSSTSLAPSLALERLHPGHCRLEQIHVLGHGISCSLGRLPGLHSAPWLNSPFPSPTRTSRTACSSCAPACSTGPSRCSVPPMAAT